MKRVLTALAAALLLAAFATPASAHLFERNFDGGMLYCDLYVPGGSVAASGPRKMQHGFAADLEITKGDFKTQYLLTGSTKKIGRVALGPKRTNSSKTQKIPVAKGVVLEVTCGVSTPVPVAHNCSITGTRGGCHVCAGRAKEKCHYASWIISEPSRKTGKRR